MGTTTFSGPIKAGTIKDTTGTTPGTNVANVGNVVMAQTALVDLTGGALNQKHETNIVIPARSRIVNVVIRIVVPVGTNTNITIGSPVTTAWSSPQIVSSLLIGTALKGVFMPNSAALNSAATTGAFIYGWADTGPDEYKVNLTQTAATATGKIEFSIFYTQGATPLPEYA